MFTYPKCPPAPFGSATVSHVTPTKSTVTITWARVPSLWTDVRGSASAYRPSARRCNDALNSIDPRRRGSELLTTPQCSAKRSRPLNSKERRHGVHSPAGFGLGMSNWIRTLRGSVIWATSTIVLTSPAYAPVFVLASDSSNSSNPSHGDALPPRLAGSTPGSDRLGPRVDFRRERMPHAAHWGES